MDSFHDWYMVGVAVDMNAHELTIQLCDSFKKRLATLYFHGATRFIVEGFAAQNIIYSIHVLDEHSPEYASARTALEASHPWGDDWPMKKIARISASLGAEVIVEFDSMQPVEK
jgi:hypothetical protein